MSEWVSILRVIHIITAILMAWPFYALVAVNQRARLGPPLGDRADVLVENLIKSRAIPCFIFQGTVLVTGLALLQARGVGLIALLAIPALAIKFVLLLGVVGLLSYVFFSLQRRIDALFERAGSPVSAELAAEINPLRAQRKMLASVCLLLVLLSAMLGAQVWVKFPVWLTAALTAAIVLLTWRAYRSEMRYGWL